jgi:MSHA pilin protein MshD
MQTDLSSEQRGVTLIELVVFIVIIAISLVALLRVFDQAVQSSVDPIARSRALECAQAKLDEVLARRFDENNLGNVPACGSAQPDALACAGISPDGDFDDVGDYNGQTDTSLANCSIAVTVAAAGADLGLAASQARRLTVTATSTGGEVVTLAAYKVNF